MPVNDVNNCTAKNAIICDKADEGFKIVKLIGGLGNQMFQYAFGRALAHKTNSRVLFDKITHYEQEEGTKDVQVRFYALNVFKNLDINFASQEEINFCLGKKNNNPKFIKKWFHQTNFCNKIAEEGYCKFNKDFLKDRKTVYFEGYFQNEKYFLDIKDEIREQFAFFEIQDGYYKMQAKKILSSKNPVFIHLRRGDYKNSDCLCAGYYKNAVKYIKDRINSPLFFVFGENCREFAEKELDMGCNFEFIGTDNVTPLNHHFDMQLMSLCSHGIIANSTYSFWGAWLINNKDKIIVAPSPWLYSKDDIICKDWVKLSSRG